MLEWVVKRESQTTSLKRGPSQANLVVGLFFFYLIFIGGYFIYNVVLVSTIKQNESVTCMQSPFSHV